VGFFIRGPLSVGVNTYFTATPVGYIHPPLSGNGSFDITPAAIQNIIEINSYEVCDESPLNFYDVIPQKPIGYNCQHRIFELTPTGNGTFKFADGYLDFIRLINKKACANPALNPYSVVPQAPLPFKCKRPVPKFSTYTGNASGKLEDAAILNIINVNENRPVLPQISGSGTCALTDDALNIIRYVNDNRPHFEPTSGTAYMDPPDIPYVIWVNEPFNKPHFVGTTGDGYVSIKHEGTNIDIHALVPIQDHMTKYVEYRTPSVESLIVGTAHNDVVAGNDLITTAGSPYVSTSLDLSLYNIAVNDTIYIEEPGFNAFGYVITAIDTLTRTLTLGGTPIISQSITDGKFSINRLDVQVKTSITAYPRISVKTASLIIGDTDLYINGKNRVDSYTVDFATAGVVAGCVLMMSFSGKTVYAVIQKVDHGTLYLDRTLDTTIANVPYKVYTQEQEIPGPKAVIPAYEVLNVNSEYVLRIRSNLKRDDLVLVETLGMNHKRIVGNHYIWGDRKTNAIKTTMPTPIALDMVDITKNVLTPYQIDQSNTVITNNTSAYAEILTGFTKVSSTTGRYLSVKLAGLNINFLNPVVLTVEGELGDPLIAPPTPVVEVINPTTQGAYKTTNLFSKVNKVSISFTPYYTLKKFITVEIDEYNPMTISDTVNPNVPKLEYRYILDSGTLLTGSGNTFRDTSKFFSKKCEGCIIKLIVDPTQPAQWYSVLSVSRDTLTLLNLDGSIPVLAPFIWISYEIWSDPSDKCGFQNGYFFFKNQRFVS
jgi:hypothetical protein